MSKRKEICTLKLCNVFRDLYQTLEYVNDDGDENWSHQTIVVDRKRSRRATRQQLRALVREAEKQIAKI